MSPFIKKHFYKKGSKLSVKGYGTNLKIIQRQHVRINKMINKDIFLYLSYLYNDLN